MKYVAFIGTRNLNLLEPIARQMYEEAAIAAGERNYIVRTGAAPGADQFAAELALSSGGTVELYLPWRGYEKDWVDRIMDEYADGDRVQVFTLPFDLSQDPPALSSLSLHPNPANLGSGAQKLHARNYRIVVGERSSENEVEPSSSVIAVPQPPEKGGTGQGIRIARSLGIRVFNLSLEGDRQAFLPYLKPKPEVF